MATTRTIEVELATSGLGADGRPQRVPLVAGSPDAIKQGNRPGR